MKKKFLDRRKQLFEEKMNDPEYMKYSYTNKKKFKSYNDAEDLKRY